MPINNLNKVLNLILSGSLLITMILIHEFEKLNQFVLYIDKNHTYFFSGFLVILLIPVAIFFGIIIEIITEFIREFYEWAIGNDNREKLYKIIGGKAYKNYRYLRDFATQKLENTYTAECKYIEGNTLLVGIFFNNANSETINWIIQHYSTYRLLLNFLVLLPLIFYIFSSLDIILFSNHYSTIVIWFLFSFMLYRFAILKRLYTYESLYRQIVTLNYCEVHEFK